MKSVRKCKRILVFGSIGCIRRENSEFIHSGLPFLSDACARLAAVSPPSATCLPRSPSERAFISVSRMSDNGMSYLLAYGHLPNLPSPPADSNVCVWPQGASGCDNNNTGGARCQKRRMTANKKERRRTQSINMAFSELRNCIPQVPADTKLSKIKTLKLAASYIAYLTALLHDEAENPPTFNTEVGREPEQQNVSLNLMDNMPSAKRKASGRTGWPQHVWALTLKRENPS